MSTAIAIYAPLRLDEDSFLLGFVARQDLVDHLLRALRAVAPTAPGKHHLIVGPRGMGKTSLLRRLAIGIARDSDLAARYIPLTFREEQYNVRSLDRFWRNCGEALAEWLEKSGEAAAAAELDRRLLEPGWGDGRTAAELFAAETAALGRRPVLFIDNLDLILGALPADGHWALRKILQGPGGPIVIGAATQVLKESGDRQAAFYEFFQPHMLDPLSESELLQCLLRIAENRGAAGAPVRAILSTDPGRLRTLHRLTGGNPRVLALIYQLLERGESDTVFEDLEALLDQLTPFYKARVEDYRTDLQRAVIDAIALHWDPITSHDLAQTTSVEITTISSQLARLKIDGLIEEVPTSGARAGYQLVERFFNIWYLMRHGTRRTRQKMLWLTAFLKSFYAPDELSRMRTELDAPGPQRCHPYYREALLAAAESVLETEIRELVDRSITLWENNSGEEAIRACDEIERKLGATGKSSLRMWVRWANISKALILSDLDRGEEAIRLLDKERQLLESKENIITSSLLSWVLRCKADVLSGLGRDEDSFRDYDDVVRRFEAAAEPELREQVAHSLVNKGVGLGRLGRNEEAIAVCDDVVRRFEAATELSLRDQVARALVNKGARLGQLGRSEEAITVYDDVVHRFEAATEPSLREQVARALINKGFRLGQLGRSEEEIAVYDDVVHRFGTAIEPSLCEGVARALVNKSVVLGKLGRSEEAIAACDDVVRQFEAATEPSLREQVTRALVNKGITLGRLGRGEKAAAAFRHAVDRSPDDPRALASLADILADLHGLFDEAEAAYRSALRIENNLSTRCNLTWLCLATGRGDEAGQLRGTLDALAPVGTDLLDAALQLGADNFGAATAHLDAALNCDQDELTTTFFADLLRLLRIVEKRGYGDKLIAWFTESGQAERQAPVFAAFVAFVRGEAFLRDVNPEVREPATKIYEWLASQRKHREPETAARKKPMRRRGRPTRRGGR